MSKTVVLTGKILAIHDVVNVARHHHRISIAEIALKKVRRCRAFIENALKEKRVMYGVTTGFGDLKSYIIPLDQVEALQENLIRSHAAGVGALFTEEIVRAAMLIRINSLIHGNSGVREEFVQLLAELLNKDVYPVIPEQGSVGSSGDLAPLSHLGLVMMGEGFVVEKGKLTPAARVLTQKHIAPLRFQAKEGLALNNGTSFQTAVLTLALHEAWRVFDAALVAAAMSMEAFESSLGPFNKRVHALRPHPGQKEVARRISVILQGSKMIVPAEKFTRIQDAYSIRCIPQVLGASLDAMNYVSGVIETEINAVTDNPLLFDREGEVISAGNFHGQPIALASDFLSIAMAEVANIAERRIAKMVDHKNSEGLPPFLIASENVGLQCGFMIPQYTAAALVSENKVLAHPASVDSIPTSANQEDHVSMGTIAARQSLQVVKNVRYVVAIELMAAAQALDIRGKEKLAPRTKKAHSIIRQHVPFMKKDEIFTAHIDKIADLIEDGLAIA